MSVIRLTGAGVTVDARAGHGSISLLNLARIGIAWIASCALDGHQDDDLKQVAGSVRPDDHPTVGIFAGVFDSERMVDGVMA